MAVAVAPRTSVARPSADPQRASQLLRLALVLGKARVVGLVTFTAVAATTVAAGGHPDPQDLLAVIAVGVLAGGGAGALNHLLDRDIDRRMARTCRRPLVLGQVSAGAVWLVAVAALAGGLVVAWRTGPAVALHTLVAAATYILIYTRLLKRHTPQSVVVGGWTGAAAVLAGWQAADAPLTPAALGLAAVVFLWTPAHFWSLAIARLDEYRRAGVPALPVVAGVPLTQAAVAASVVLTMAAALVPLASGELGRAYLVALALAGAPLGGATWRLLRVPSTRHARQVFAASNLALLVLFAGAALDARLGWQP